MVQKLRSREPTMAELFAPRIKERGSITADQALIHMVKVMMGTGMLSLPLAFKNSGLWLGMVLLACICLVCIFCTRQLVFAQHYIGYLKSQPRLDYANVMRSAVEIGPPWIRDHGYFWKQVVNVNMFMAQFGFCCVYFVFMADNLKQFFDQTSQIHISQAGWIALLAVPIMALCTIRELKALAPLAAIANIVYLVAVCIVLQQLFLYDRSAGSLPAVANWNTLPLFFGTVMFAFEGVAVVLPIENQMDEPLHFITHNGVLNTSCLLVLILYMTVGFFGYLRFGNDIMDTLTLNLPQTNFYQVAVERQEKLIYGVRMAGVICTCLLAELIPHLALFISLVGSVAGTSLTLVFPPMIELLCCYSKDSLTTWIWTRNIMLMMFAVVGFVTGTYASMVQIVDAFGKPDV
nr:Amino acid transporter domain containing protein [Haemonchus contortus]